MYIEQYLAKERHQERLRQAEEERAGRRIVELRKLQKQQERAERALLEVWARVEQIHSIMSAG